MRNSETPRRGQIRDPETRTKPGPRDEMGVASGRDGCGLGTRWAWSRDEMGVVWGRDGCGHGTRWVWSGDEMGVVSGRDGCGLDINM
ncbi:hypothetical protein BV898_05920 [Hypsibius exemplaris]|uniref:Uncharacterized protein n=1 Tax=Hypsibius exemplaris TaxID=2072580 RepID=A0A1W0WY53_HYPEX|nr:hypothetical protein BV898_05920 [Hypsibius exemplaris]